jgi:hypothetical protein
MTAPIDALIIVSDLHCGSPYGLAPPSFKTDDGNELGHGTNAHQAWLWHWWVRLIAEAAERLRGATIGVIVNGDAPDIDTGEDDPIDECGELVSDDDEAA